MEGIDHAAAGAILLVSVVQAFADPQILKQAPRMAFFKAGAATGFVMGSLLLLMWHVAGRPVEQFGADGWIGSQPIIVAVAAAAWPLILAGVSGLLLGRFRPATARFYSGYAHLMPRSPREIPAAFGAGTFAAFGEEVAYRGFLIWYLSALTGTTVAVLASSLIFGIAHGYQGKTGMVFASLAGLVLAAVYLLSGSLLIVLWIHGSYNIASFTVGYRLLHARPDRRG